MAVGDPIERTLEKLYARVFVDGPEIHLIERQDWWDWSNLYRSGLADCSALIRLSKFAARWLTDERGELQCFEVDWR